LSNGLVALATFLAAGVEWIEALTIVLAVGMFKSWRTAVLATISALLVLLALIAIFGVAIGSDVSAPVVRTVVGAGLLLFGLGWLYKAILRSTGLKALHDETAAFKETREELMTHGHAFGTAFGGVFLEGLEVVFIVVALGGLRSIPAAAIGAGLSLVVVVVAGIAVRHPLSRVPENTVKYAVGVMLTSFGTYFAGEGLGVDWWQKDLVLLPLIAGYGIASLLVVQYLKRRPPLSLTNFTVVRYTKVAVLEVWSLFVTDGLLAIVAVAALLFVVVFIDRLGGNRGVAGFVLIAGVLAAVIIALVRADRTALQKRAASATAEHPPVSERAPVIEEAAY
jgi:uncharacterized membrane protein